MERYRLSTDRKQHTSHLRLRKLVPPVDTESGIGGDCIALSVGTVKATDIDGFTTAR